MSAGGAMIVPRDAPGRPLALAIVLATSFAGPISAQTVFVSNEKDNTLSLIDANRLEVTQTLPVGKRPRGITLNEDGTKLYICANDDNTIEILDTGTLKKIGNLPAGLDPERSRSAPTIGTSTSPTRPITSSP